MASTHLSYPELWAPKLVEDHLNARYIAVAGLTLMIWTHFTTLDEEIRCIWNTDTGITLNKALFVAVRYFTTLAFGFHCLTLFFPRPSFEVCRGVVISVGVEALCLVGACDLILLLRTWAIYDRTRKSIIYLSIVLAITHLPTLVLGARWMTTLRIGPSKLYPVIPGCFLRSTAMEEFWRITFPSVIYNTALTGASIYKIWTYHRTQIKTPLLSLLVRDGIVYYIIILTVYLCNGFFLFYRRLVIITIEGRFVTWVVAVTCAQMQLNLRTAVQHTLGYATTCHQQQTIFDSLDGRLDSPYRPGVDTLILGSTATELEYKHGNSSTENEVEQGGRYHPVTAELATTAVHVPQSTTGGEGKTITASTESGTGKQTSCLPQFRRASSHSVDITSIPNATSGEARPLPSTSNAHSGPPSGSVTRVDTARAALGVDLKHNMACAGPTSSSSAGFMSCGPKKQNRDTSILLNDMNGIPSPHDLERGLRGYSPRSVYDSDFQIEVPVEYENRESGVSPMPQSSECKENATRSASLDEWIMTTGIGVLW